MIVLAADTSTSYYSIALCDGGRVLAEASIDAGRRHSECLMGSVDWLLKQAGLDLTGVELLAVAHGPGSFTGLRVGVSAWKGLALGAGLPLVGVSTLDAMTRLGEFHQGRVCTILDAKMEEVFGAVYRFENGVREVEREARVCSVENLVDGLSGPIAFLGEGAEVYRSRIEAIVPGAGFVSGMCSHPRGSAVAQEGLSVLAQGASGDAAEVLPVYLRKSQAEEARSTRARQSSPA